MMQTDLDKPTNDHDSMLQVSYGEIFIEVGDASKASPKW